MKEIKSQHSDQFYALTPDHVMEAVEQAGYMPTGRYTQLNSYENRVFDIVLEKETLPQFQDRLVGKFYRPGRWSKEAILEEHEFLSELHDSGIPAIQAIHQKNGTTISEHQHIYMALYPKFFGRMPQELFTEDFKRIGRTLARIHNVGSQTAAKHRLTMNSDSYGWPILDILETRVAPAIWPRYEKAAEDILNFLDEHMDEEKFIRIHGDCHKGNLLLKDVAGEDQEFFFVDFDDFCNGPPAQDFWMLFSGDDDDPTQKEELQTLLSGYDELREVSAEDLRLMRPLRGLRILHYAGWIARRWADPNFPQLFPQFDDYIYWAEETEALERIAWSL